jgi:HPt (histidine-containing phosphotransfer) domain-containing protein
MMTASPPESQSPSSAKADERPAFVLGGLLLPLLDAGYEDDAREVVQLYLEDHLAKVAEIRNALSEGDLETCGQAAHLLIGSAGGIGASDLAAALTDLEKACRAGDELQARQVLRLILEEEPRVLETARRFLEAGRD